MNFFITFILIFFLINLLLELFSFFYIGYKKNNDILTIPKDSFFFYFKNLYRPNLYNKNNYDYINIIPTYTHIFIKYYHSKYGIIFRFSKEHKYIEQIYKELNEKND